MGQTVDNSCMRDSKEQQVILGFDQHWWRCYGGIAVAAPARTIECDAGSDFRKKYDEKVPTCPSTIR
eukprot:1639131-Amphidinium_carterae.1